MITRNYDMMKAYQLFRKNNPKIQELDGIYIQDAGGRYQNINTYLSPFTSFAHHWFLNQSDRSNNNTGFNGYTNDACILWIGGESEKGNKISPFPGISEKEENYNDYQLFQPFKGTDTEDTSSNYEVMCRPHIFNTTEAFWNKEEKKWQNKVTREFKNISGGTIVVKELGIFHRNTQATLVAREVFENPIVVGNEGYFKVSYTFDCENLFPNENMRRYRKWENPYMYTDYYYEAAHTITPTYTRDTFTLFCGEGDNSVSFKTTDVNVLCSRATIDSDVSYAYSGGAVKEAIGYKVRTIDNNSIYFKVNGMLSTFRSIDIQKEIINETEPFSILSYFIIENGEIEVQKDLEEKNIIWIVKYDQSASNQFTKGDVIQIDNNLCDIIPINYRNFGDTSSLNDHRMARSEIFVDCTDATTHIFKIPSTTGIVYKIKVNLKEEYKDTLLYYDAVHGLVTY